MFDSPVTLSSIYNHFYKLKKKALGKHCFSTIFSMQSVSKNPLIATFQFSSAASLNLGWSQNGVLENGLITVTIFSIYHKTKMQPCPN